jgi:hypothetical protein
MEHLLLNQASGSKEKSLPFAEGAERKLKLIWEFEFGMLVLERVNIGNVRRESFLTSNFRPSRSDLVGFRSEDGTSRHLYLLVTVASTRQIFDTSFCARLEYRFPLWQVLYKNFLSNVQWIVGLSMY